MPAKLGYEIDLRRLLKGIGDETPPKGGKSPILGPHETHMIRHDCLECRAKDYEAYLAERAKRRPKRKH